MRRTRIGDAIYRDPFRSNIGAPYKTGTWLVTVEYDDGDRFVTVAPARVLAVLRGTCGEA